MTDTMRGHDIIRNMLWMTQEEPEKGIWIGTGVNQPGIITHTDLKSALTYYLMGYSQTNTIEAVIGNDYRIAMPANAAATTIIDSILKELGVKTKEG